MLLTRRIHAISYARRNPWHLFVPKGKLQRVGLQTVDTAAPDSNSIKNGGLQTRTPPNIKNGSTQSADLRPFGLTVFLSRFAANSSTTAFWSFSVSTR